MIVRQLQMGFAAQWERQPTPEELSGLVENRVREEVLYREALAMGLDKDDDIVKRRMAQKMQFLAEDVANAHEPTTAELKAWFEKNGDKFALPGRVTFRHLYFSPDRRGQRAHDDAVKALAKIAGQPEDSKTAAALADRIHVPGLLRRSLARAIGQRASDRSLRRQSSSSNPVHGKGQSSPAMDGTWCS